VGGEWRPTPTVPREHSSHRETLAKEERLVFLWGLFDDGPHEVCTKLLERLWPGETIRDLAVNDSTTIPGIVLGWLSLGIVTQRQVEIEGRIERVAHEPRR